MFAVKRIFNRPSVSLCRTYAANPTFVNVTHEDDTGISTLSMMRQPVNGLNKILLNDLTTSLLECQKRHSKGIILTSSIPNIFSAGLDIMEMYNRSNHEMTQFWTTLQNTWFTLYGLEIPVAAAINGASPAGGCLLALSCEYRVLLEGKHRIGFNETHLGIVAPAWFRNLYIETIGYRKAELALLRGTLFSPKEALEIGLVDELASDNTDAIKKCQDYIQNFKNMPAYGRNATKQELRKRNLHYLKLNLDEDLNQFLRIVQSPEVQAGLKLYIESLRQK